MFLVSNGEALTGVMLIVLGVYWLIAGHAGSRRNGIL